jgi:hypothetical protein
MNRKMKKLVVKILMIVSGAAFTLSVIPGNANANPGNKDENKIFQERMIEAESYFQAPVLPELKFDANYKVYDPDQNLVYESKDKDDRKLQKLIGKSDFLVEINNNHIYQLSR